MFYYGTHSVDDPLLGIRRDVDFLYKHVEVHRDINAVRNWLYRYIEAVIETATRPFHNYCTHFIFMLKALALINEWTEYSSSCNTVMLVVDIPNGSQPNRLFCVLKTVSQLGISRLYGDPVITLDI
jgi:hypothetical protein